MSFRSLPPNEAIVAVVLKVISEGIVVRIPIEVCVQGEKWVCVEVGGLIITTFGALQPLS